MEAQQRRACEHPAEPRLQDRLQRAGTERADVHALDHAVVDGELDLRHRDTGCDPARQKP